MTNTVLWNSGQTKKVWPFFLDTLFFPFVLLVSHFFLSCSVRHGFGNQRLKNESEIWPNKKNPVTKSTTFHLEWTGCLQQAHKIWFMLSFYNVKMKIGIFRFNWMTGYVKKHGFLAWSMVINKWLDYTVDYTWLKIKLIMLFMLYIIWIFLTQSYKITQVILGTQTETGGSNGDGTL